MVRTVHDPCPTPRPAGPTKGASSGGGCGEAGLRWAPRPGPAVTLRPRRSPVASGGRSRLAGPCGEDRDYLHNASLQGTHLHVPLTVPGGGGKHAGGLRGCHAFRGGLSRHLRPPCRTQPSHPLCVYLGTLPPHAHCQGGAGRSTDGDTHTQAHAHRGRERSPADAPEPPAGIRGTLRPSAASSAAYTLGPAPLRRVGAVGDPPSPRPRPTPSPSAHPAPAPASSPLPLPAPTLPRPLFLSQPRLPPHPAPQRPHPCRCPVCPLPSLLCRRPPVRFRSVLCAASPDSPRTPGSPGASSFVSAPRPPPAAPLAPHSPPQPWRGRRELALLAQRREPRRGPPRAGSFFSLPTRARAAPAAAIAAPASAGDWRPSAPGTPPRLPWPPVPLGPAPPG